MTTRSSERERPRVLVSDSCFRRDRLVRGLESAGVDVVTPTDAESFQELVTEVDALIVVPRDRVDAELLGRARRAKAVISMVIGTDNIAVDEASHHGIVVPHGAAPENYTGMAESVVLLALALRHRMRAKERALRSGQWRPNGQGETLAGARVGLVGFGRIGQDVARRLSGWDVDLLAHDPHVSAGTMAELAVRPASLEQVLKTSDVVAVQVTLTDSTRGMIGARELALMSPTAHLINTSRGGVVDEIALADALTHGRLAGAAVDVWENEPPAPGHPLVASDHDDLILTGHNIGHAEATYDALADLAIRHALQVIDGVRPDYLKNPEVWPGRDATGNASRRIGTMT